MNFQSFNLDLKDENDLVFFNSSDREVHILRPIKEKVSTPVFTLLTFGTEITLCSSTIWSFLHCVMIECDRGSFLTKNHFLTLAIF